MNMQTKYGYSSRQPGYVQCITGPAPESAWIEPSKRTMIRRWTWSLAIWFDGTIQNVRAAPNLILVKYNHAGHAKLC